MKKGMGLALAIFFAATPAFAADSQAKEIAQLRRELRAMREEVSTLRRAVFEIAESDRRRAAILSGVLGGDRGSSKAAAASRRRSVRVANGRPKAAPSRAAPSLDEAPAAKATTVGRVTGRVVVPNNEPVAYVYVQDLRGRSVRRKTVKIDQRGKQFVPNWAVIRRGTTVSFPNQDNIYHNVFSRTKGSNFDLGLYRRGDESKGHRFLESGPVDVYCNIHPQMAARILVVPNKHFAKVDKDGTFTLDGVPVGKRTIAAWSPTSKLATISVQVNQGATSEILLQLKQRASAHRNKHGQPYRSYP